MIAERIMVTNLVTAHTDETISAVLTRMREARLRMLPVLDNENHIMGVISTFCLLEYIVPDYLISGELNQISYAPDMGILRQKYKDASTITVAEVMNHKPLLVHHTESLLSVAAALTSFGRHEYVMVVDKQKHLLGVISAGDILDRLEKHASELNDA